MTRQEIQRRYRESHRDQIQEYNRRYRVANFDKRKRYNNKFRLSFPDKIREYYRRWYVKNRDYFVLYSRKWRNKNRGRYRSIGARRHARKVSATVGDRKSTDKVYKRCAELRQWFDVVVDHIVPLAKGGKHASENLQIIYADENRRKHTSLTYKPRVVFK